MTGGAYQPLGADGRGLDALYASSLAKLPRSSAVGTAHKVYTERFQIPLALAIGCLLLELVIVDRRRRAFAHAAGIAVALLGFVGMPRTADADAGDHAAASSYNAGTTAYRGGDFAAAQRQFEAALRTPEVGLQGDAYYDLGNARYRDPLQGSRRDDRQRMPMTTTKTVIAVLATISIAAGTAFATAAHTASAELHGALAVGSPAELTVTIDANAASPPRLQLDGASVRYTGQMSRTKSINGSARAQVTFLYAIVPRRAGALDIPALSVTTDEGVATTAPIHATVAATGAAAPSGSPSVALDAPSDDADGPHALLRLELPSHTLYVGQSVPVKIRAYFRAGTSATLDGLPHLSSDAFTFSELSDKPVQTQVELRGVP